MQEVLIKPNFLYPFHFIFFLLKFPLQKCESFNRIMLYNKKYMLYNSQITSNSLFQICCEQTEIIISTNDILYLLIQDKFISFINS